MAFPIMIQGTMSNAGKSLMAAALCRIFRQDGYSCAPFKSQNMALNSFVTKEGLEIGRAQAMQAEAAGIEPVSDMNPLLLKPMGNSESQIVVNGRPVGNMSAAEYYRVKSRFLPDITGAYERLAAKHDIIVIEGAGSPVEMNLKDNDFVNMGLARALNAPVLLVGDIDRGGVFAQLYGTLMLLEEEERELVKGIIVNKFRGDMGLFKRGREMLEDICKKPVLGVVPYTDCDIEDEDSLAERLTPGFAGRRMSGSRAEVAADQPTGDTPSQLHFHSGSSSDSGAKCRVQDPDQHYWSAESECALVRAELLPEVGAGEDTEVIDIAVVRLPGMSNFTDFDVFAQYPQAVVRYVEDPDKLGHPDFLIIPGTKNTIRDLRWLKANGLGDSIRKMAVAGIPVFGICGGYQILGTEISDPCGAEHGGCEEGLGLLDCRTVFGEEKVLRQTEGRFMKTGGVLSALSGAHFGGYEIHMGRSDEEPDGRYERVGDGARVGELTGDQFQDVVGAVARAGVKAGARMGAGATTTENSVVWVGTQRRTGSMRQGGASRQLLSCGGSYCGNVYGCYVHGIFDSAEVSERLMKSLCRNKGIAYHGGETDRRAYKERQYDILAEAVRSSLDMELLYRILRKEI